MLASRLPVVRRPASGRSDASLDAPIAEAGPLDEIAQRLEHGGEGPLRAQVYEALRWAILTGRLAAGRKLTEVELAGALKVSRTPLREAFRRLESERLITVSTSRGVVVRGMTVRDLAHIYEVRLPLEVLAAQLAATHATDADMAELEHSIRLHGFFAQHQRLDDYSHETNRLHSLVAESTGNPWLALKLQELRDLELNVRGSVIRARSSIEDTVREHTELLDALRARDAQLAGGLAGSHLRNLCRRVLGAEMEEILAAAATPLVHQAGLTADSTAG